MRHPARKKIWRTGLIAMGVALLCALSLLIQASATQAKSIRITQIAQHGETLSLYFNALSSTGEQATDLSATEATVTVGAKTLTGTVSSVRDAGLGMRYIFLVDISDSYNQDQFDQVQSALEGAIVQLGEKNFASIITMGSSAKIVCDFTDDQTELYRCAKGLELEKQSDVEMEQGISMAFSQAGLRGASLPDYGTILLFSGVHLKKTAQYTYPGLSELREQVNGTCCPLNVITFTAGDALLHTAISELKPLVEETNGTMTEAETSDTAIEDAVAANMEAAASGYVATVELPSALGTGETYGVELSLEEDGYSFSDTCDLRITPISSQQSELLPRLLWGAAIALAVGALALWIRHRRREKRRKAELEEQYQQWMDTRLAQQLRDKAVAEPLRPVTQETRNNPIPVAQPPLSRGSTVALFPDEQPDGTDSPAIRVTLLEQREGLSQEYDLTIADHLVIGRESGPDRLFLADVAASRRHCELFVYRGGLYVRDLGSLNHTYVCRNGTTYAVNQQGFSLEQGDSLRIGSTSFGVHFNQ